MPRWSGSQWSHKVTVAGVHGDYSELFCNSCFSRTTRKPLITCQAKQHKMTWEQSKLRDGNRYKGKRRSKIINFEQDKYHNLMIQVRDKHGVISCICCGSAQHLENDHVVPQGDSHLKNGGIQRLQKMLILPVGFIQGLCEQCNTSKRSGFFCYIHGKYLGPSLLSISVFTNELNNWSLREGLAFFRRTHNQAETAATGIAAPQASAMNPAVLVSQRGVVTSK